LELSRCCLPAYFDGLAGDANVLYAGATGGFPGLYQLNFTLPSLSNSSIGLGTSCGSELKIEVWFSVVANGVSASGGGTGSNYLSIPVDVSADENPCGAVSTAITLTSNVNPSAPGQLVTFTVTVGPVPSTGTVTFLDGTTVIGTALVANGMASFSTSDLTGGAHSITASYSGDSNHGSAVVTRKQIVQVNTTTMLTGSPNPSNRRPVSDSHGHRHALQRDWFGYVCQRDQ
jgi:hypothetical protein